MRHQLGCQITTGIHFSQRKETVQERKNHHQLQRVYVCNTVEICSYSTGSDVETSMATELRTVLHPGNLASSSYIFPESRFTD